MKTTLALLALTLSMLMLLACVPRPHLRKDYGKVTRQWFVAQQVYTVAAKGNPSGLDPEEAAAIHDKYTQSLADRQSTRGDERPQVLILDTSTKKKQKK